MKRVNTSPSPPRHAAPSFMFRAPLQHGVIVSRPNRFVMMVATGGHTVKCHCPTTGRIGNLHLPGLSCLLSASDGVKRKTAYTVEAISTTPGLSGPWIGINQTAANRYLEFFIKSGSLRRLASGELQREVKLGRSRIDFLVGDTYIEVKTPLITLPAPPSVSSAKHSRFDSFDRLIRHMGELRDSLSAGRKAIIILCYLYDAKPFEPPRPDRSNSKILVAAAAAEKAGVQRWQVNLRIDERGVSLLRYFRSRPYRTTTAT